MGPRAARRPPTRARIPGLAPRDLRAHHSVRPTAIHDLRATCSASRRSPGASLTRSRAVRGRNYTPQPSYDLYRHDRHQLATTPTAATSRTRPSARPMASPSRPAVGHGNRANRSIPPIRRSSSATRRPGCSPCSSSRSARSSSSAGSSRRVLDAVDSVRRGARPGAARRRRLGRAWIDLFERVQVPVLGAVLVR